MKSTGCLRNCNYRLTTLRSKIKEMKKKRLFASDTSSWILYVLQAGFLLNSLGFLLPFPYLAVCFKHILFSLNKVELSIYLKIIDYFKYIFASHITSQATYKENKAHYLVHLGVSTSVPWLVQSATTNLF